MSMRTVYLIPKIYDHRLETLAKENGFNKEKFFEVYNAVKGGEAVIYYEYNFPYQGIMSAVLASADVQHFEFASSEDGFNKETALKVIDAELYKEVFRLINDLVSRELRSSIGEIDYISDEKKETVLKEFKTRWEKFPEKIFENEAAYNPVIFQTKPGLRLGCSGGGSCASCTHPTCGYRSA